MPNAPERAQTLRDRYPDRSEHPDSTPVDVPFGFSFESLADTIGRMVRVENLKNQAKKEHLESFEESQDFGEDDDEIKSPHEMTEMQEDFPAEWLNAAPEEEPAAHKRRAADATPPTVDPEAPPATPEALTSPQ